MAFCLQRKVWKVGFKSTCLKVELNEFYSKLQLCCWWERNAAIWNEVKFIVAPKATVLMCLRVSVLHLQCDSARSTDSTAQLSCPSDAQTQLVITAHLKISSRQWGEHIIYPIWVHITICPPMPCLFVFFGVFFFFFDSYST